MPRVGFEPTISAGERPKTYALDRAATGTGVSGLDGRNYVCRMAGEELPSKKATSSGQTCWWRREGVRRYGSIRSGKCSFYRRQHEQTRWCQHYLSTSDSQCWIIWIQDNFEFHHDNDPKHFSHLVKGLGFYNCPQSFLFNLLSYDQQMHNYFTNNHTVTCFDTSVSSSDSL